MTIPAVSILIPAFNAEHFVDNAIDSVLEQTFHDWEIIAVDDASVDGTLARLEAWQQREPRIRIYRNQVNRGMTQNWNVCLEKAKGDFVIKLDADDVLRPRAVEIMASALSKPACRAAAVRTLLCDERLEPIGAPPCDAALMRGGIDPYVDNDLPTSRWMEVAVLGQQPWHSSAIMVPRAWLASSGGFDERFGCASDTELILRVLRCDGIVSHSGYVGCYYRNTQNSVSTKYRRSGWLLWEEIAVNLLNFSQLATPELAPAARDYRVYLWRRWKRGRSSEEFGRAVPTALRTNVENVLRGTKTPPLRDRLRVLAGRVAARM